MSYTRKTERGGSKMRFLYLSLILIAFGSMPAQAESGVAPDVTEISAAHSAFVKDASRKNYKALFAALQGYDDTVTVETVEAYIALLSADVKASKFRQMRRTALAATDHFEPVSDVITKQYLDVKSLAAIALFNDAQRPKAMLEMAHVIGRANQIHNDDWTHPEWATNIKWRAEAWLYAMEAYFAASDRVGSYDEQEIIETYALEDHQSPNDGEAIQYVLPVCEGEMLQTSKLIYPREASREGMYGAVILEFELEESGAVTNVDVKASVPLEGFRETAADTVAKWRYVPIDGMQAGDTCEMPREKLIMPVVFQLR